MVTIFLLTEITLHVWLCVPVRASGSHHEAEQLDTEDATEDGSRRWRRATLPPLYFVQLFMIIIFIKKTMQSVGII